jgi:starch synthase
MKKRLKVLFVSAEVSPYAKTGGLADVAGSLPIALMGHGCDIRVAMPRYRQIDSPMDYVTDFPVMLGRNRETCIVRKGGESLPVYFIDSYRYFDREGVYCFFDDADRFAFLCVSILEMLPRIGFKPDIIHCNDWHTGPICMLLEKKYRGESFYSEMSTVYTIHNLRYQGNFPREAMRLFNVDDSVYTPGQAEFYGTFSFMKCGIVFAQKVNTVSSVYAEEIKTPMYGEGMEGVLKARAEDLTGILNGIDYDEFNPETDSRIYVKYNGRSIENKALNKRQLQKEMGLAEEDVPLLGIVSRLSDQKGLDLVLENLQNIVNEGAQFVLLGTGDPRYEDAFKEFAAKCPGSVAAAIKFDAGLAQKIYAGCDMFLMPSRFEPCGLGQMISLRYGTIPIVRATGGLAETVVDYNLDPVNGNGFSFREYSPDMFLDAVKRALRVYREDRRQWRMLVERAMTQDFSWKKSAEKYIELYEAARRV